jgi:hypothetical protein
MTAGLGVSILNPWDLKPYPQPIYPRQPKTRLDSRRTSMASGSVRSAFPHSLEPKARRAV